MTQLAANRAGGCPKLAGIDPVAALTILDTEKLYFGGMMAIDHTDEVQMASDAEGLRVIGVCPKGIDNTDDGEDLKMAGDGAIRGIVPMNNSSTYAIPRSAIGQPCFVEDDNTVAAYSTNLVAAGMVHDVDDDYVWVDMRPWALALAREMRPPTIVSKTDAYTVTAEIAFGGRTLLSCDKASLLTVTLPSAVAGMRVGVKRAAATAAHDLSVQAATGDKIQASDGFCAAGKKIDNTVDAISQPLWLRAVSDVEWIIDNPYPNDVASWVKNDT